MSSGSKPAPNGSGKVPGAAAGNQRGEYMGPVFIIRELDKVDGQYDAFVTTGGIQEVRRPTTHPGYQQNPSAGAYREPDEDSEYFGVLVTADTVRLLGYPDSVAINVSLPVLLTAVSSRMPWLLVLRRKDYPQLFEYQQQQQRPPPAQQQPQQPQLAVPGSMQIPQRRRYHPDRDRRDMSAAYAAGGYDWDAAVDGEYGRGRTAPVGFERQLLSTMCYNFVREYSAGGGKAHGLPFASVAPGPDGEQEDRSHVDGLAFDYDAYTRAAAADLFATTPSPPEQSTSEPVMISVPKRVS